MNTVRRCGRPRRGTAAERLDELLAAATRVFLRDGYDGASIDKVAGDAGVSTRTIYERFKNKAELLGTVIERLVERDMADALSAEELHRLEPRQALTLIARYVTGHACRPDSSALFRILVAEAHRFPELVTRIRHSAKSRLDALVIGYLRCQSDRGTLQVADPERVGVLFMQMVCAELHEYLLFGASGDLASLDLGTHVDLVIDIFMNGTLSRSGPQSLPLAAASPVAAISPPAATS